MCRHGALLRLLTRRRGSHRRWLRHMHRQESLSRLLQSCNSTHWWTLMLLLLLLLRLLLILQCLLLLPARLWLWLQGGCVAEV